MPAFSRVSSRQPQPRESSWRGSPGAPQKVTRALSQAGGLGDVGGVDVDAVVGGGAAGDAFAGPERSEVSRTTGTLPWTTSKPKRAGSPKGGSRLKSGWVKVTVPKVLGFVDGDRATPRALDAGQEFSVPR